MKKWIIAIILLLIFSVCVIPQEKGEYEQRRKELVKNKIIAQGIKDTNVINSLLEVERHLFVPPKYRQHAYKDRPLPIGKGQTISQPYIVALMTQLLEPDSTDRILEIGTGSGYQAAVLSNIVDSVYSIEIICSLASSARKRLKKLGYKNTKIKCADGFKGWKEYAPFDGVIVTCAPPEVPEPLIRQLKVGARLVIPVGEDFQQLKILVKKEDKTVKKNILPVRFVPMKGKAQELD